MQLLSHVRPAGAASATAGDGPLVVCLHGFTHDATTWRDVAMRLPGLDVVALDLPGHGASGAVTTTSLEDCAGLVHDTVTALCDGRPVHLVGYSLGGRVAMHAACAAPSSWRSVTLVSASPGISDVDERARRARDDDADAAALVADPEAFLRRWEALPLFAGLSSIARDERDALAAVRRSHDPAALAAMLRATSVGHQEDLRGPLASVPSPVHCVAGARDVRYVASARAIATARRATGVPTSVTVAVGAGHVVHLEAPGVVAAVVSAAVHAAG